MRAFMTLIRVAVAAALALPGVALAQDGLGDGPPPTTEVPVAAPPTAFLPGVVAPHVETLRDGQAVVIERITVPVPATDPSVIYTFSDGGASIYAARLQGERYQRHALPQLAGVPEDKIAAGPVDLVSTWSPGSLPYGVVFRELSVTEPVTRVARRATGGVVKDGRVVAPTEAERRGFEVNRPVTTGDTLVITAPAELAGEYRVGVVGTGGSIEPVEAFPIKDASGVAYEVRRTGDFGAIYANDPYATRVSKEPGLPVTYVWPDPRYDTSSVFIEKRFEAGSNPYALTLTVTIYNLGGTEVRALPGLRVTAWQHPNAETGSMFSRPINIHGAGCRTGEAFEHTTFPSLQEDATDNFNAGQPAVATNWFATPTDWVAVDTSYFVAAAIPMTRVATGQCQQGLTMFDVNTPGAWSLYAAYYVSAAMSISSGANACLPDWLLPYRDGARSCDAALAVLGLPAHAPTKDIEAAWGVLRNQSGADVAAIDQARDELNRARNGTWRYAFTLYNGPKDQDVLMQTNPTLRDAVDLGMFAFISKPLHSLLVWFEGFLGSWAWAIVFLTFAVKLVLLPLTNKSYSSMQKMQKLKPKLDELKKQHGGDRQAFAKEQMALFKREGVNPLTGCLPMLLQMPVWFGLYQTIYTSVELYRTPMGLWIDDLSAPDPFYILPIILGLLMFVQTFLTTSTATMDGMQGKILKFGMPIMFSVFMLFLPSGLVLYILVNVLLTIAQNLFIRRRMGIK